MLLDDLFQDVPVSGTTTRHWAKQDAAVLESAADKLMSHQGNPWILSADARHFDQFASAEDRTALAAMTEEEKDALLWWWSEE